MSNEMWSVSTNGENYYGKFGTIEEAISEGKASGQKSFWVGVLMPPIPPEELFNKWSVEAWIDSIFDHDDYMGEWAEGAVDATRKQTEDLADQIRPVISKWLDENMLRPMFFNIDPDSVRRVCVDGDQTCVRLASADD